MSKKGIMGLRLRGSLDNVNKPRERFVNARQERNHAKKRVGTTFYVPPPTFDRLKLICLERSVTMQVLYETMADEWLARNNEPPFHPEKG